MKQFVEVPLETFREYPWKHPALDRDFVASIAQHGILNPPVLAQYSDDRLVIMFGQRRLHAAMEIGQDVAECVVYDHAEEIPINEWRIIEHSHQNANPFTDLEAVQNLIKEGHSIDEIAKLVFKTKPYIYQILKLANLTPTLLKAGREGKVAMGVLESLAKKDSKLIETAETIFNEKNRLTGKDVANVAKVNKRKIVAEMFAGSSLAAPVVQAKKQEDTRPFIIIHEGEIVSPITLGYQNVISFRDNLGHGEIFSLVKVG